MKLKVIVSLLLVFPAIFGFGQLKTGFKTGLNFASFRGPSEKDAEGINLEEYKNNVGFHIGMTLSHKFTDNFGVRGEILYSKKGAKYAYTGASYRNFKSGTNNVFTTGDLKYSVQVTNSYIDIPVLAFGRFRSLELSAGVSVGFLVQSQGNGSMSYLGKTTPLMNSTGQLEYFLSHNYRKDDPGQSADGSAKILVQLDGQKVEVPQTIGAYYDYSEVKGNLYNTLDVSAIAGLSYYLSRALYASVRLQYGLVDVTNNEVDVVRLAPDANRVPVFSTDKDVNMVIQASVGFSF